MKGTETNEKGGKGGEAKGREAKERRKGKKKHWRGQGGVWGGGLNPPLASRITSGIRTKPQRNFFGTGVGVPHYLASAYLKS
jgi:hypothetical protein